MKSIKSIAVNSPIVLSITCALSTALIISIFSVFTAKAYLGLVAIFMVLNWYVSNRTYILAHACETEHMDSIIENGFNRGVAEDVDAKAALLMTQQGNAENVCFSITDMAPVIKARGLAGKDYKTIYMTLPAKGNLRVSEMTSRMGWTSIRRSSGKILEVGIDRKIVNEAIAAGNYVFDKPENFGKGFMVRLAKLVKPTSNDLPLASVIAAFKERSSGVILID